MTQHPHDWIRENVSDIAMAMIYTTIAVLVIVAFLILVGAP